MQHLRAVPRRLRRRRHHLRIPGLPRPRQAGREGRPQAPHRVLLRRPHGLRPARHRDDDPHRRQRRAVRQHRPRPHHRPALLPGRRAQGPLRHHRPRHPRRSTPAPRSTAGPRASAACSPSPPSPPSGCPASPDSGARCWRCSAPSTPPTASAAPPSSPSWRSPRSAPCSPPRTCSSSYAASAWARSPPSRTPRELADVQTYEFAAWTPLVALTVLAGLWPAALLGLTDPAVQQLLAGGKPMTAGSRQRHQPRSSPSTGSPSRRPPSPRSSPWSSSSPTSSSPTTRKPLLGWIVRRRPRRRRAHCCCPCWTATAPPSA